MKHHRSVLSALLLPAAIFAAGVRTAPDIDPLPPPSGPEQQGLISLFDGKSLDGWTGSEPARQIWSAERGRIFARNLNVGGTGPNEPDIWTVKSYRNFTLSVDWRLPQAPKKRMMNTFTPDGLLHLDADGKVIKQLLPDAGDSGIYLRGGMLYQVNIWSQPMGSGDLNDLHKDARLPAELRRTYIPKLNADAPFGQWNRFVITLEGDRVTVVLNGKQVIDHAQLPGIPAAGPIGLLQEERGDLIEFANVYIKELP